MVVEGAGSHDLAVGADDHGGDGAVVGEGAKKPPARPRIKDPAASGTGAAAHAAGSPDGLLGHAGQRSVRATR
ncbi:hypothetical protein SAV31267_091370 [Streptomyces avermitilis]|uniref:Uncharacterized protein n=1 Tax=Streptomyces avermitilis TaxID=33903 RepID=A0A4D4N530_STRAX|nr:hypothetical protein SAVMC3_08610 [Streptomyces avermitilis]GDY79652.1 hypothetical protein SAV31267_091370 [Streptomyces avermitilis]